MRSHNRALNNGRLKQKPHVFGYENEPSHERPTGFEQIGFEQSTPACTWEGSMQSTFDKPSRAVRKNQGRDVSAGLVSAVRLAAAEFTATVFAFFRS
jgi:hypothetical protein